jgi:hypothetical protein
MLGVGGAAFWAEEVQLAVMRWYTLCVLVLNSPAEQV